MTADSAPPRPTVESFCGCAIFLAIGFSWLFAFTFWNRLTLWRDRGHYKQEIFVVGGSHFEPASGDGDTDTYWLQGAIGRVPERLIPELHGAPSPRSADELAQRYPKGTKINVLYNPAATTTIVQNESLRVKEAAPDFWEREASRRLFFGVLTLCPVPLALSAYIAVRLMNRRRLAKRPSSVKWVVPGTLHRKVARTQQLLLQQVRLDSSCPSLNLPDCFFGLRSEGNFLAWFALEDSAHREIGEVFYKSCGNRTIRRYLAALLIDSTTFEGVIWSDAQDTLVCYRNDIEVCRVRRERPEPEPAESTPAASWWQRFRSGTNTTGHQQWSVEVGGKPFGNIEMRTRTERRLYFEGANLRLPIQHIKEPQFSFRAFEHVIPHDEPLPTDELPLTVAFLLNVAFRTRIVFRLAF